MGLIKNFKKAVSKDEKKELSFPSVIDEGVKPADVTEKPTDKPQEKVVDKRSLDIKPFETRTEEVTDKDFEIGITPKELPDLPGEGFFIHLYSELKDGKLGKEDVSSKDLIREMQNYWHNDESLIKHKSQSEQNKWLIERSIAETMEKLAVLEQQWKMKRIKVERLKRDIEGIEFEIAQESKDFKELVRKLKFHQEVPEEETFKLFSGREIKSLNELLGALKIMDDESFGKHVTADRNDFADWVEGVLKEPGIANEMRQLSDKASTISYLEQNVKHEPSA